LTDRLQEALWREILHLVNDGVATTGELDESIITARVCAGRPWAMIYHPARRKRHAPCAQFGPA
jgi:hypothetical protein